MQIGVETSRLVEIRRIFVVDDDEITRAVLQFMLQDDNETHDLAGLAAAYAQGARGRPDLVLLGLSVLASRGTSLLGAMAERWPGVRILLVAPAGQDAAAQALLRSGAHGVLTAPFKLAAVRRQVDLLLGRIAPPLVQLQLLGSAP